MSVRSWLYLIERIKTLPRVFWLIAVPGIALPWATGASVKVYLQAHGEPTISSLYFVNPLSLVIEIPVAILWASPYLALGLIAQPILQGHLAFLNWTTRLERAIFLVCGFMLGAVGTVRTFIEVFRDFDPLYFLPPFFLFPVYYVGRHMVTGLVLGLSLAGVSAGLRKLVLKG